MSQSRRPRPAAPAARTRPQQRARVEPASAGNRARAERLSRPVLVWLSRKPVFLLPVLTVVLLVVGLAAPAAVGVPVLLLLAALVGWLSYLSWPVVLGVQRVRRVVTVGMLAAAAAGRALA